MKRILTYVEGETEEAFLKRLIHPHLLNMGLFIIPTIATTKRVINGPDHKGSYVPFSKARKEIKQLLADSDAVAVTSMLDFYGLPNDYPGKDDMPAGNCYTRVRHLESELGNAIDNSKFIPYLSLHEFEALVLVSPDEIVSAFPGENIRDNLKTITQAAHSPEEVNEVEQSHPSARLMNLIPTYGKKTSGPIICERIGLPEIRNACPHFNEWLGKLEALLPANSAEHP